jgi:hypothetical protein
MWIQRTYESILLSPPQALQLLPVCLFLALREDWQARSCADLSFLPVDG